MDVIHITTHDRKKLYLYCYTNNNKPKMILQFAHGMSEHAGRYDAFFNFLLSKDIFVYAHDQRGHGRTAQKTDTLGHFDDHDGFEKAVLDLLSVHDYIKEKHNGIPQIIMGHSMGSFLVRRFIQRFPFEKDAVVLSGTGYDQGLIGTFGRLLSLIECTVKGKTHPCMTLHKLSIGSYDRHFGKEGNWLSRDETATKAYEADPLCGQICTAQFYHDLLTGIATIHKKREIKKVCKEIPILLVSGTHDPVGHFSIGVRRVAASYEAAGIKEVTTLLYPDGRHEMLHETNKVEVMQDIYQWLLERTLVTKG